MILIVGLGNPGEKFENTRHNIGFMVLDQLLKKFAPVEKSSWENSKKFSALLNKVNDDLLLVKPMLFMNASGMVVKKIMDYYKIPAFGLYVVHDDLDLTLGKIKISVAHSSAGHKGVESIIESLNSNNFVRVRVGIGSFLKVDGEKFVLSNFDKEEKGRLGRIVKKSLEVLRLILEKGVEKAANQINQ